jgi:hypothetical protein
LFYPVVNIVLPHLGNAIVILMIPVKSELIPDPQADEDRDSHPGGKTGNVNKGITFVLDQVPKRDLEIVLQHKRGDSLNEDCAKGERLQNSQSFFSTIS